MFPGRRPTPRNRFFCCDSNASHSGLWQVFGTNLFPGRRPRPAVECRAPECRPPDAIASSQFWPGNWYVFLVCDLRQLETGEPPGVWTTGSYIQLIVAESQGLTDPHAWPVSRYCRAAIKECGTYMYANRNLRENQYWKKPLESRSETRMLSILLLWTPSL